MSEPASCAKFRKQGGGRGKPARDAVCADCGIIWSEHSRTKEPTKLQRPATLRFKRKPSNKTSEPLTLKTPTLEPSISQPEPPIQPERSPEEEEARVREMLSRLFEEHFGPDCPTVEDW